MNLYSRQEILPWIGKGGQKILHDSRAAIIGIGGTGCASAMILARSGIGYLSFIDRDIVDNVNLHRQILYGHNHIGLPKAEAAKDAIKSILPSIKVESYAMDLDPELAIEIAERHDIIIDGTDNFEARYLINDVSVKYRKPWVYGGAVSSYGVAGTFIPGMNGCLRCLFPEIPPPGSSPTCDTAGVFPPAPILIGTIEASEAIKTLLGIYKKNVPKLIHIDLFKNDFRAMMEIKKSPICPACNGQYDFLNGYGIKTTGLCGRSTIQVRPEKNVVINLEKLVKELSKLYTVREIGSTLSIEIEEIKVTLFADGRALFHNLTDDKRALALYSRIIGN